MLVPGHDRASVPAPRLGRHGANGRSTILALVLPSGCLIRTSVPTMTASSTTAIPAALVSAKEYADQSTFPIGLDRFSRSQNSSRVGSASSPASTPTVFRLSVLLKAALRASCPTNGP